MEGLSAHHALGEVFRGRLAANAISARSKIDDGHVVGEVHEDALSFGNQCLELRRGGLALFDACPLHFRPPRFGELYLGTHRLEKRGVHFKFLPVAREAAKVGQVQLRRSRESVTSTGQPALNSLQLLSSSHDFFNGK